jgi:hypothetical protein
LYSSTKGIVGEEYVLQTTTVTELKAPPEANTSGEANVSQTSTLPELKAPPEANMSQKEISANMNLPNILGEPPVQDEDTNLHKQPVEGEETNLSEISPFGQNNNNGLLFAPTCTTCFNENKYLSTSEKKCAHQWNNECLISTGEYVLFPSVMFHHGYYKTNPTQFSYKRNYSVPQPSTPTSYDSHDSL